jgi:flagellar biosynthesis/type III secretory pathway protein FliH
LASHDQLIAGFEHVADHFTAIKHDPRAKSWLHSLVRYALAVSKIGKELVIKALSKILDEKEAEKMATSTMQELIAEGRVEGRAEGRVEGRTEGEMKFGRNAVLNVLRKRFTKVPKKIEKAISQMNDPIALESLHSYALDCQTLDEFADALK